MTEREPHDGYLVFQGGLPEVQKMLAAFAVLPIAATAHPYGQI